MELYGYPNDVEKLTPDNTETLGLNVWLQGPYDRCRGLCKRLPPPDQCGPTDGSAAQTDRLFLAWGFSDADRDLSSGSLAQKENYELELDGTVQLDWTAEEMAKATDVESLLEEENEQ